MRLSHQRLRCIVSRTRAAAPMVRKPQFSNHRHLGPPRSAPSGLCGSVQLPSSDSSPRFPVARGDSVTHNPFPANDDGRGDGRIGLTIPALAGQRRSVGLPVCGPRGWGARSCRVSRGARGAGAAVEVVGVIRSRTMRSCPSWAWTTPRGSSFH